MEKKILGNSSLEITRIGFGAWAIGGPWLWGWGDQNDSESIKTIHKALDMGINWIDTAPIYGLGHSEEIISKALKDVRIKPLIFTKCGLIWDSRKRISNSLKRSSIEKEIDDSLRRLAVDIIDLYQIHWPNPDEEIEEAWETMAELVQKQKVRYIGVSNFSVKQIKRVEKIFPVNSNQPPYSLLDRHIEKDILPYCYKKQIGTINYSPMASGLLSGKMTRERVENLPHDDWRRKNNYFKEPQLSRNLAFVEILKKIGIQHNCTAGAVAIAWTLINPAITGTIVGLRRSDQIESVIKAVEIKLTPENIRVMEESAKSEL
jgi:aryl-alcohol dehydrogenase-like predicted oxidoreductase